jgi:type I site-specific restriction-modification system R (restriction) subunit
VPLLSDRRNIVVIADEAHRSQKEKLKSKWAQLEAIVGSEKRLKLIARDIVDHFEKRLEALDGKAMVVCMSRRICVELYREIVRLRSHRQDEEDDKGAIKVVMTGSASDPLNWQPHIRNKPRREALAQRFRNANDPFKVVIVRDMWLTGFGAPSLHTMYVDKPMREANERGEKLNLTEDEVAFYGALETNDSAVKVLGDETLRDIARELVKTVRANVTIAWTMRENVRAQLRVLVKRILRKYGYPPDKQERRRPCLSKQRCFVRNGQTESSRTKTSYAFVGEETLRSDFLKWSFSISSR